MKEQWEVEEQTWLEPTVAERNVDEALGDEIW
jgi:hypothetical protein